VSGVRVAHRSKRFVVAAEERSARTHSLGCAADALVQFLAEFHHCVGLVNLIIRKARRSFGLEGLACCRYDGTIFVAVSSDIEQAEDNALWARARKLVEVATYPMAVHQTRNFGACELRQLGNAWTTGWDLWPLK
jgi:hypothetical protein